MFWCNGNALQPGWRNEECTESGHDAMHRTEVGRAHGLDLGSPCFTSRDSATIARAPLGRISLAMVTAKLMRKMARSRITPQSNQSVPP